MSNFSAIILLVLLSFCHGQSRDRNLLLVGGGLEDDNEEIYGKFVEMSGMYQEQATATINLRIFLPRFYISIFKLL